MEVGGLFEKWGLDFELAESRGAEGRKFGWLYKAIGEYPSQVDALSCYRFIGGKRGVMVSGHVDCFAWSYLNFNASNDVLVCQRGRLGWGRCHLASEATDGLSLRTWFLMIWLVSASGRGEKHDVTYLENSKRIAYFSFYEHHPAKVRQPS
jgi:hypothetical protein